MKRILLSAIFSLFILVSFAQVGPLYRYNNSNTWGHFYTTNWNELGNGKYSFKFEGVVGFVHKDAAQGTMPMYRYFNTASKTHFYTMNWEELGNGKYGYNFEGVAYYAYKTQVSGTVPLYRYFHKNNKAHFFTANYQELGEGRGGYTAEGIAGYIFPDEKTALAETDVEALKLVSTPANQPAPVATTPDPKALAVASGDYIQLDEKTSYNDFSAVYKGAILNQVIAIWHKNQPLMLIVLPANGSHSPAPGTYKVVDGKSRTNKKESGEIKIQFEPGFISVEGGTITITENDGIHTFSAENVQLINPKTKETHKLSFKVGLFIQKA